MYKKIYKKKNHSLLKESFPKIPFILFVLQLRTILSDCKTILDLGCGELSPIRFVSARTYGVDAHKSSIVKAKKIGTHDFFKLLDVRNLSDYFRPKSFDAVVALDLIEHLSKEEGYKLIRGMEQLASKKVIIFTPNGFLPQKGEGLHLNEHLSGWQVDEMRKLKYKVIGVFGHKFFRSANHKIRFKPEAFWGLLSEASNWLYTRWYPQYATALLCIKKLKD